MMDDRTLYIQEEFEEFSKVTDNPVAAAILVMANNMPGLNTHYWDSFGHELALGLRAALFGSPDQSNTLERTTFRVVVDRKDE